MASVVLPWLVAFAVCAGLGLAFGRRAVAVPLVLGLAFGVLLAVNGAGDTALWFVIAWWLIGVGAGVAGARVGAAMRER